MTAIMVTIKTLGALSATGIGWAGVGLLGAIALAYMGLGYSIKLVG